MPPKTKKSNRLKEARKRVREAEKAVVSETQAMEEDLLVPVRKALLANDRLGAEGALRSLLLSKAGLAQWTNALTHDGLKQSVMLFVGMFNEVTFTNSIPTAQVNLRTRHLWISPVFFLRHIQSWGDLLFLLLHEKEHLQAHMLHGQVVSFSEFLDKTAKDFVKKATTQHLKRNYVEDVWANAKARRNIKSKFDLSKRYFADPPKKDKKAQEAWAKSLRSSRGAILGVRGDVTQWREYVSANGLEQSISEGLRRERLSGNEALRSVTSVDEWWNAVVRHLVTLPSYPKYMETMAVWRHVDFPAAQPAPLGDKAPEDSMPLGNEPPPTEEEQEAQENRKEAQKEKGEDGETEEDGEEDGEGDSGEGSGNDEDSEGGEAESSGSSEEAGDAEGDADSSEEAGDSDSDDTDEVEDVDSDGDSSEDSSSEESDSNDSAESDAEGDESAEQDNPECGSGPENEGEGGAAPPAGEDSEETDGDGEEGDENKEETGDEEDDVSEDGEDDEGSENGEEGDAEDDDGDENTEAGTSDEGEEAEKELTPEIPYDQWDLPVTDSPEIVDEKGEPTEEAFSQFNPESKEEELTEPLVGRNGTLLHTVINPGNDPDNVTPDMQLILDLASATGEASSNIFDFSRGIIRQVQETVVGSMLAARAQTAHTRPILFPRITRRTAVLMGMGHIPTLYEQHVDEHPPPIDFYVDVSGSMERYYIVIPKMTKMLAGHIGKVYQFSDDVFEVDAEDSRLYTTGGTRYIPVAQQILESGATEVVVLTDNTCHIPMEMLHQLGNQLTRLVLISTPGYRYEGKIGFDWLVEHASEFPSLTAEEILLTGAGY